MAYATYAKKAIEVFHLKRHLQASSFRDGAPKRVKTSSPLSRLATPGCAVRAFSCVLHGSEGKLTVVRVGVRQPVDERRSAFEEIPARCHVHRVLDTLAKNENGEVGLFLKRSTT